MKKLGLILLLSVFVFTWGSAFADDNTVAAVQQGIGALGGFLKNKAKGKGNEEKGKEAGATSSSQVVNADKAPFKCQFQDFAWGTKIGEARKILLSKGIINFLPTDKENFGYNKLLSYDTKISDLPCKVVLVFSPVTELLFSVTVNFPMYGDGNQEKWIKGMSAIQVGLREKYGEPYLVDGSNYSHWGKEGTDGDYLMYGSTFEVTISYASQKISKVATEESNKLSQEENKQMVGKVKDEL